MFKELLVAFILVFSSRCYSQVTFEKGYFINNNGTRVDCLIKNIEWKNNPTAFHYKSSETGELKEASIELVREFGVLGKSKYVRDTVRIDRSSEDINRLSSERRALFNSEQLFLKVLIEGKASLYLYEDGNLIRFFYKTDSSDVEQLIYKSYRHADGSVGKNTEYKQQLWNNLKCSNIAISEIKNINYHKKELVRLFLKYNKCHDAQLVNFEMIEESDRLNLTIRPGLISSVLSIQNYSFKPLSFDREIGYRIGIEAEFVLPFNKGKWAIFIEPTYQHFKTESKIEDQGVRVDYRSIELPVGLRHNFYMSQKSKIFITAAYTVDFSYNSKIDFEKSTDLKINSLNNLSFGLGFNYDNRYSLEMRYGLSRELTDKYLYISSDYKSLAFILGYTLF